MRSHLLAPTLLMMLLGPVLATPAPQPLATDEIEIGGLTCQIGVVSDGSVSIGERHGQHRRHAFREALIRARMEQRRIEGSSYASIRAMGRSGQEHMLLLRLEEGCSAEVIHEGPIGKVGRDAERSIELDLSGSVLRYQTAPGITRCDGERRLFAERYTPSAGWRPASFLPARAPRARLRATRSVPANIRPRPLPIYRFVAASQQAGVANRADLLAPPQELSDGRIDTLWRVAGNPHGAWVTARAQERHKVLGLRLVPPPSAVGGVPSPPQRLAVVFEEGDPLHIEISRDRGAQWARLPQPVLTSCLSLVILDDEERPQGTGLAEVGIYSDLEAEGLAGLMRALASRENASAEAALRALTEAVGSDPEALIAALEEAMGEAAPPARARLHRLLLHLADGAPWKLNAWMRARLAGLFMKIMKSAHEEERPALWESFGRLGKNDEIAALASDPTNTEALRREALIRLGRRGALEELLRIRLEPAADGLHHAQSLAQVEAARARSAEDPATQALIDGTIARLRDAGAGADFITRCRAIQQLGRLEVARRDVVDLLSRVLIEDEEPALRQSAARALGSLRGLPTGTWAGRGLRDRDAGVRLETLRAITGRADEPTLVQLDRLLREDAWPQVRRAAIEARGAACVPHSGGGSIPALRQALSDADPEVRRLALTAIWRCEGLRAGALLLATARRRDEPPAVRGQACVLLTQAGGRAAAKSLGEIVLDALEDDETDERHIGMIGTCLRAGSRLGDHRVLPAIRRAMGEPLSPAIRLAGVEALADLCRSAAPWRSGEAARLLASMREDEDARVRASARAAASRCGIRGTR